MRIDPGIGFSPEHLPRVVPNNEKRLAVVVASGMVLKRSSWSKVEEMSAAVYERMPSARPKRAANLAGNLTKTSYRLLDVAPPEQKTCTHCAVLRQTEYYSCNHCASSGKILHAVMHYVTETPVPVRKIFSPAMPHDVKLSTSRVLAQIQSLPDCLLVNSDGGGRDSPYRSKREAPSFHGHLFGRAMSGAKKFLTRLERMPTAVQFEVRLFAWPILLFDSRATEWSGTLAMFLLPDGRACLTGSGSG